MAALDLRYVATAVTLMKNQTLQSTCRGQTAERTTTSPLFL